MSSGAVEFLGFESLPPNGALLIPGRLDHREFLALARQLSGRATTWLVEENALVEPATRDYLAGENVRAATFSENDDPEAVGQALRDKITGGGLLVYISGDAATRFGTACHVPSAHLRFLCGLGLPLVPVAVSVPAESALATENRASLPAAIFCAGDLIDAAEASTARFREGLMAAAERTFSARQFLSGSLGEHLIRGLKRNGRNHLFDGSDDSSLSFDKILAASLAFATEIKAATEKPRVGIILPPGRAGLIANLATVLAGKVPVNLNFTASREAIQSSIRQAGLDRFITADPFVRKVSSFPWPPTRELLFIERILPLVKKRIVRWALLSKILPAGLIARHFGLHKAGRGNDEAVLLFTSGSSGEPKGVPLTHRNVLANVCQFGTKLAMPAGQRMLGCLPLFHSFGSTVTLWYPILEGIDLVTYPSPLETKRLAELIGQHRIYLLLATPTFLRGYMRRVEPEQLASLRLVITGAEKLPPNLAKKFEEKFGIRPLEGYGLTETSPATNINLPDVEPAKSETPVLPNNRLGSAGLFLFGIAARITNPADDAPVALDQTGVIWLKGANIFSGYLDRPDLTTEVIIDDWFKTGDVGHVDDDGFLYIEGRIRRFSKIAGEMVPHESVEAAINRLLGLDNESERKIAVVGIPDQKKGEAIALLSCVAGETLQQEVVDLRYKLMDEGIPSLWCPKLIIPVDEIPVLPSGKLDLKTCEELAVAGAAG